MQQQVTQIQYLSSSHTGRLLTSDFRVPTSPIRLCLIAPSLDITGGQSRQAAKLLAAYAKEPSLTTDFIPHNPRMPDGLRWLQQIKFARTVVTTLQ